DDNLAFPLLIDKPHLDTAGLRVEHDVPRQLTHDGRDLLHRERTSACVFTEPARFRAGRADIHFLLQFDSTGAGVGATAKELLEAVERLRLKSRRNEQLDAASQRGAALH